MKLVNWIWQLHILVKVNVLSMTHQVLDESWECRNPYDTYWGMRMVFSQNYAYSSAESHAKYQDILLINGSSQPLISKLILVIVFVIFMTMNS